MYWKPQKYVICDWKNIENLKAVVKLWAWAQTPQGHLNMILIKWQNRAKLVQVWKPNCNRKGGWIKTWIWYEFWLMLECQEWNKYERNETVTKVARVLGSQHPVQAAQSQFLASQCKSYLDDYIGIYQVVLVTVNNMFDGPLKCIFSSYDDFLPRLHGLLQAKVSDQTLVISLCIWLLRSPTVDWKAFIVAHMGEVFRLNNLGLTSGLEDQNNKDKKQKHICIKPNEENVRTRKKSINRHKSDKNKHFQKTYFQPQRLEARSYPDTQASAANGLRWHNAFFTKLCN